MYITKKKIKGKEYYYLRKSVRERGKVKSKNIAYLGKNKEKAEKKSKEIIAKINKKANLKKQEIKMIYFVHGTTLDNEANVSTGQAQTSLSELGIKQSKELKDKIKIKDFDVVFCSDLKRAVDSAKLIFDKEVEIIKDKRLRECDYGKLNQARSDKVRYLEHINDKFPEGESLKDVEKRIREFLNFLYKEYNGKQVAIVAHRAPQLAIEVLLNKKSWETVIKEDWREKKKWQPGWKYKIEKEIKNMEQEKKKSGKEDNNKLTIEDVSTFCKEKGFVFSSSEIYGKIAGFWDFGQLGVELYNNIKQNWWKFFVNRESMLGIDCSIISHPKTWEASGHLASFSDVAVVCKKCKKSTKIDKSELGKIKCECGGEYEEQGEFNLLFKTNIGALNPQKAYLRGETAQGMFLDFKNVVDTSRQKLPFGIAQVGKCFRNEIAPRDFLFRSREFTIAEFEFFIHPDEKKCGLLTSEHKKMKIRLLDEETQRKGNEDLKETTINYLLEKGKLGEWHAYWLAEQLRWYENLGINTDKIKIREHTKDELSHYSSATFDIDYEFPFGSQEIAGNANRGQYDLQQHKKFSGKNLEMFDEETKKKVIPRVIEPTFGIERAFLAVIVDGYEDDKERGNIVLKINPKLSPVKAAVLPIVKNKKEFVDFSREVYNEIKDEWNVQYDSGGSIGRRYARQDEIGTPYCITIDGDSLKGKDCTIRDRDTTEQIRVKVKDLKEVMRALLSSEIGFGDAGEKVETRKK